VSSDAVQHDLTELAMDTRVSELIRKTPLVCLPSTPLQQVFVAMEREKAGSMMVADETGALQGILTRYDLIKRILLPQIPLSTPIRQVMSQDLITIDAQAGVLEAMLMMVRHKVRHLPVMHQGFLVGLVSERDLFAHQRSSLRILSSSIEQAESIADLKLCTAEVLSMARRLMGQGVAATSLARLVSHLNDALTRRVIDLVVAQMQPSLGELPRWSWLALGSEGREEQTVATDQDNAIIFEGSSPELRQKFQSLAAGINHGLADIGFPLCTGGVMAMNEKWCRSVDEWRHALAGWFSTPNPQALLDSNIFLDFRGLHGDIELANELRAWVFDQVAEHRLFLRSLAQDAMRDQVGSLTKNTVFISMARAARRRGWQGEWLAPSQFEMKRMGTAPVVYFTRLLALAHSVAETSTDARLHGLVAKGAMSESETQQMRDAFNVLQRYRMRAQLAFALAEQNGEGRSGGTDHAKISPNVLLLDTLSIHEHERLSEALSELAGLRARLEMDFLR
jgi:CBS domain-containing protein